MRAKELLLYSSILFLLESCLYDVSPDFPRPSTVKSLDVKMTNKMPLVIIVGQSNASGYAPYETAPSWLVNNDFQINNFGMWNVKTKTFQTYKLGVNVGSDINNDNHFGFDIYFAYSFLQRYDTTLLCIKQTLGGVPISVKGTSRPGRWYPDKDLIPIGERCMIEELEIKLNDAKAYAQTKNSILVPIAVLFHQGEADAEETPRRLEYESNLIKLNKYLRTLLKNDSLPIISGELYYKNTAYTYINDILNKQTKVDNLFMTVDMSKNQTNIGDNLHYDAAAFEHMGQIMFKYYDFIKEKIESPY